MPVMIRCLLTAAVVLAPAVAVAGPTWTNAEQAAQEDPDFLIQGEYTGTYNAGGEEEKTGVQVIALGGGKFRAVGYEGGLPGDGWDGQEKQTAEAELKDGVVLFKNGEGLARIEGGVMTILTGDGKALGKLTRVQRKSKTLGAEPPQGAVVLYGGADDSAKWKGGKTDDEGLLMQGVTSLQKFGGHSLHLEFRLPYKPQDRGQGRGNSGMYLQGRYEVQMLDSFGLEGKHNECGGIYSVKEPDVNMAFPPLAWQTYDVDFTAARYDADGKPTSRPRVTVRHNGVVIHDDVELPAGRGTTAAPVKPGPDPGPVYLQNHGNPVRYRNIWVVEK